MSFSTIGSDVSQLTNVTASLSTVVPNLVYTLTFAITPPSLGSNRVGVILANFVSLPANITGITSITWDGGAVTLQTAVSTASGYSISGYRLGMTQGATVNVVITFAAAGTPVGGQCQITAAWAEATNSILFDNSVQTSGTSQNPDVDTPISAAGLVLSGTGSSANALAATPFPDGTLLESFDAGGNCFISGYSTPGASGTINQTHAYSQNEPYTGVGISFIEQAAGNPWYSYAQQ